MSFPFQTYDFLPPPLPSPPKEDPLPSVPVQQMHQENSSTQKYSRSQSVSTQGTSKNRPMSRHSFSSETQSLPPTPPLSPNTIRRRMDKYDIPDEAMSSVSRRDLRQLEMGNERNNNQHHHHQMDNYRSFNDLARSDLFSSRRSSFFDYPREFISSSQRVSFILISYR